MTFVSRVFVLLLLILTWFCCDSDVAGSLTKFLVNTLTSARISLLANTQFSSGNVSHSWLKAVVLSLSTNKLGQFEPKRGSMSSTGNSQAAFEYQPRIIFKATSHP